MVRVLFDSNIYGLLVLDDDGLNIIRKILEKEGFIIHDFSLIRKELRDTPQNKKLKSYSLRIKLLQIYDRIVKGAVINEDKHMNNLAEDYFKEYQKLGGMVGRRKIINDFKIVACASIKRMDIIYSEDRHSLKSENAVKAYNIVNFRFNLRTPNLIDYHTLKKAMNELP